MKVDLFFFDMLEELGVTVEYTNLDWCDDYGRYIHAKKLILLHNDMPPRLHTFTLAHETGHAVFGDEPSMFGPANAKMERRADEWAVLRLINIERYREEEVLHEGHAPSIAHALGVVTDAVEVFQSILLRTESSVYLQPRIGRGQWTAKVRA